MDGVYCVGREYFDGRQWHICPLWLRQCDAAFLKPTEAQYQRHWRRIAKVRPHHFFLSFSMYYNFSWPICM